MFTINKVENMDMAKAFSEQERKEIKQKIRETAIEAFKEHGVKNVTIRQLANAANISLGGFYNFYLDKDELLLDIIYNRAENKIQDFIKNTRLRDAGVFGDPLDFISSTFYRFAIELLKDKDFKGQSAETLKLIVKSFDSTFSGWLIPEKDLMDFFCSYWTEHGKIVRLDRESFLQTERTAFVMLLHADECGDCFEYTLKLYIDACVHEFFTVTDGYI